MSTLNYNKALPGQYVVAVVQNQSELTQYSYADAMPMIRLSRFNYATRQYTADNILALFEGDALDDIDALVIASNACNDYRIRNALDQKTAKINQYLMRGKGILVLFQKKPPSLEFLPEALKVNLIARKATDLLYGKIEEDPHNPDHLLLVFPNKVDLVQLARRCSINPDLRGLYWGHLEPTQHGTYDIILFDSTSAPPHPLLLVARPDLPYRVAVTSLMLDWQKHSDLFENVLKYVVEGRPQVAVIRKEGMTAFDFQYMLDSLKLSKIPYAEYKQEQPDFESLPPIYPTIILDPAWTISEIADFDKHVSRAYSQQGRARIIYFDITPTHKRVVKTIGGDRNYDLLARRLVAWLYGRYKHDTVGWDESFLSTASILEVLQELGEKRETLRDLYGSSVLQHVEAHDLDGSYDNVFGATCVLLKVYDYLLGQDHPKFKRALEWLKVNIQLQELPEQVLGAITFKELGMTEAESLASKMYPGVLTELAENPSILALDRYAKFLVLFRYYSDLQAVLALLEKTQSIQDGSWGTLPQTASIVRTLMEISKHKRELAERVDRMVFRSVLYLRDFVRRQFETKATANHESHALDSEVAKAVLALRDFEEKIEFNVDEFVASLRGPAERWYPIQADQVTVHIRDILTTANRLRTENTELSNQLSRYKVDYQELDGLKTTRQFAENLSLGLTIVTYLLGISTALLCPLALGVRPKDFTSFLKEWDQWLVFLIPILIVPPIVTYIGLLRKFGRTPRWLEFIQDLHAKGGLE